MATTVFDVTPEELESSANRIQEKSQNLLKHITVFIQQLLILE